MSGQQSKFTTREIATLAMLIALTVVIARIFLIPVPMTHGNINLTDAGIMIAALMYGRKGGAIVGGASGFLLDLLSGYGQYMLFSLIVHGLEGYLVGQLGAGKSGWRQALAVTIGGLVMVGGYFISDSILYAIPTGLLGIPMNFLQGILGSVVAFAFFRVLNRVRPQLN
ncbi:membrane protein [Lactiplantibacillus fabifermentans T30PCM01]|uniref:Membrane protein n=1 Tax=Lactiplantibacillus fabifermentans T30PCM01 TaxID=1400520 RepID=W6TBX4_9LACO|nr:ECF transporter S component [Lactiplantibacillus fabifermentans]ETY73395.1 membrane protein [Lactiplantibacillus fabifermentans T30PCM01]